MEIRKPIPSKYFERPGVHDNVKSIKSPNGSEIPVRTVTISTPVDEALVRAEGTYQSFNIGGRPVIFEVHTRFYPTRIS